MKILRIAGKNLASLADEFSIDFDKGPLANAGLFAICGPTGAGKSTLLDALCLALYDATPRLLRAKAIQVADAGTSTVSADSPGNLLRRGTGDGYAEVDFIGGDGKAYRARWVVWRAGRKSSGALQNRQITLHTLPGLEQIGGRNKSEVLPEIEARIGLNFEQFTRAVLLAQNEFAAFLKSDENERGTLLETLTGSELYSTVSKRAFERWRGEQGETGKLVARLADQEPMTPEQRTEAETARTQADAVLAALDVRLSSLEQQARWHEEGQHLAAAVQQATLALAATRESDAAAAPRRTTLAQVELAQSAQTLLADARRTAGDVTQAAKSAQAAADALAAAATEHAASVVQFAAASDASVQAEAAQQAAQADLNRAKALDAQAVSASEAQAKLSETHQRLHAEADAAAQALAASAARRAQAEDVLAQAEAWLAEHAQSATLAAQWPRWDSLLARADDASQARAQADAQLPAAQQKLQEAIHAANNTQQALKAASEAVAQSEAERQAAQAALAGFDLAGLRKERAALDARRATLAEAERLWTALDATQARCSALAGDEARQSALMAAAQAALANARAQSPLLAAALAQAERLLQGAQLACASDVEALRGQLADGAPCPVCGSEEHPYAHQSPQVAHLLDLMRAEVERCRTAVEGQVAEAARAGAAMDAAKTQLASLAPALADANTALAAAQPAWAAHPFSDKAGWRESEPAAIAELAAQCEAREALAHAAQSARDTAQTRHDQALATQAAAQSADAAARAAIQDAQAACDALVAAATAAAATCDAALGELDGAALADGWRSEWLADRSAFRASCAALARQWEASLAAKSAQREVLEALARDAAALQARVESSAQASSDAAKALDAGAAALKILQSERAVLFEGRSTAEVESALRECAAAARSAQEAAATNAQQAADKLARAGASDEQAKERSKAAQAASAAAAEALQSWLDAHAFSREALETMLAHDPAWLAQEREAVAGLARAVNDAQAVLSERSARASQHAAKPPAEVIDAAALASELEALRAQRAQAQDTASQLRVLLAQDEQRRTSAADLIAQLDKQRATEQLWARMNDLIGSQDGKKFRNFAHQFTLDVLLGYANRHLEQLARRYRLERVSNALSLMVRDNEMGGELRTVHSLSGGETFLASLALALGLASLSSNRVQVESLFIDEGFGSLDAETLRVAMDALDGLQAMGRKVGVISHVQEMTERIGSRITVRPLGGGCSTITVG